MSLFAWMFLRRPNLFRFYAAGWRYVDPMEAWRTIRTSEDFDLCEDPKLCELGDEDAVLRMVAIGRKAFGLPPVTADGSGVAEATVLNVLLLFFEYLAVQKKSTEPAPTSPSPTESACLEKSTTPPASALP